jgi:hypothetical protein
VSYRDLQFCNKAPRQRQTDREVGTQSARFAMMNSNLTIQVQGSVNLFQMHESTLTRGMQDMARGAGGVSSGLTSAFTPQLLTYALRPFGGGSQLNLFA